MTTIHFLADWALRSSILILCGALLLLVFRVRDVSVRLAVWTAILCGSLAIPVMTVSLPRVPVRVIQTSAPHVAPVIEFAPTSAEQIVIPARPQPFDWARAGIALYALIAGALLLRVLIGLVMSLRLLRSSRATSMTHVRESDLVTSPVTLGILKPAIVLPTDWSQWDSRKLDAVLAHERSHIGRYDPLVQLVSAIHRALLWHSPLSWLLHSRIVRLAECASDDAAVAVSSDRASYAEILLEFMQRGAPLRGAVRGVPMARYGRADKRIQRILDGVNVSRGMTRWSVAAILVLGSPLAYVVAMANPENSTPLARATTVSAPVVVPAAPAVPVVAKPRIVAAPENKDLASLDATIENLEFQIKTLRQTFTEHFPPVRERQIQLDALRAKREQLAENDASKAPAPQSPEPAPERPTAFMPALGTVTAVTVTVRTRIDGQLMSMNFKEGEMVQAGQVLASIDPSSLREFHEAEQQRDFDAQQAAFAKDDGAPRATLQATADRASADQARVNYLKELTLIKAPITGLAGFRLAEPGQMVRAADDHGIVVITQIQSIAVIFDIPQDWLAPVLARLRTGSRPMVEAWNRDNTVKIATGVLTAVDNQIDMQTGTVKLKAMFDNKDGALFPNEFVNVRLY